MNIVWHQPTITRADRAARNHHQSAVLWFTGLSGAGKSTLAHAVEEKLYELGCNTYVLDGDNVRHGLCGDLGFSALERQENIRRIGEVAKLFADAGIIVLAAFISPYREDRRRVRALMAEGDFIEVYCKASLDVCEARDVKGMYKRARAGEIAEYTGISSPYDVPEKPELVVDTGNSSLDACVGEITDCLIARGIIGKSTC